MTKRISKITRNFRYDRVICRHGRRNEIRSRMGSLNFRWNYGGLNTMQWTYQFINIAKNGECDWQHYTSSCCFK